ncbi:hypothetical protein JW758_01040 [Candidatus Peregrinibacteria bacterium]|nr:hypothetical protein [Candidatus Peregrinibacteria bacterium]
MNEVISESSETEVPLGRKKIQTILNGANELTQKLDTFAIQNGYIEGFGQYLDESFKYSGGNWADVILINADNFRGLPGSDVFLQEAEDKYIESISVPDDIDNPATYFGDIKNRHYLYNISLARKEFHKEINQKLLDNLKHSNRVFKACKWLIDNDDIITPTPLESAINIPPGEYQIKIDLIDRDGKKQEKILGLPFYLGGEGMTQANAEKYARDNIEMEGLHNFYKLHEPGSVDYSIGTRVNFMIIDKDNNQVGQPSYCWVGGAGHITRESKDIIHQSWKDAIAKMY